MTAPEAPLLYQGVARTSAAFRLLKQMGWQEGEGLGKEKQGITEHVRVTKKKDNSGLGVDAQQKAASNWTFNTTTFDSILKNLTVIVADTSQGDNGDNDKGEKIVSLDLKHAKKATRPQGRYKKRESGKVLQGKSQADLDAILGFDKPPREIWPAFDGSNEKVAKPSFSEANCVPSERLAEINDATSTLSPPAVVKDEEFLKEMPAGNTSDWWGIKYGFVRAGSLGQHMRDAKDGKELAGVEATQSTKNRTSFCEQDQEDLYKLVQDKATKGRQGLGIADRPKKIGGAHWKGQKVVLDSSDNDAEDGGGLDVQSTSIRNLDGVSDPDECKRKADLEVEDTRQAKKPRQDKLKWKKLCRQLLLEAPALTMRIKDLQRLIVEKSCLYTGGNGYDSNQSVLLSKEKFKERLSKSSKFVLEGKKVSLVISS